MFEFDASEIIGRMREVRKQIQEVDWDADGDYQVVDRLLQESLRLLVDAEILLRDFVRSADEEALALPEAGTPMARVLASNAVLRRQLDEAVRSRDFSRDWWAARCERVRDLLKPTLYWRDYACIMANGTVDMHEVPTYQGRLNQAAHRVDEAEKKSACVLRYWRQVRRGTPEQAADATKALDKLTEIDT